MNNHAPMLSPFGTFPFLFAAILTAPFALDLEVEGLYKSGGIHSLGWPVVRRQARRKSAGHKGKEITSKSSLEVTS